MLLTIILIAIAISLFMLLVYKSMDRIWGQDNAFKLSSSTLMWFKHRLAKGMLLSIWIMGLLFLSAYASIPALTKSIVFNIAEVIDRQFAPSKETDKLLNKAYKFDAYNKGTLKGFLESMLFANYRSPDTDSDFERVAYIATNAILDKMDYPQLTERSNTEDDEMYEARIIKYDNDLKKISQNILSELYLTIEDRTIEPKNATIELSKELWSGYYSKKEKIKHFEITRLVKDYRERQDRRMFFKQLILVVVMGTFGSIIFLINNFIEKTPDRTETTLSAYVFMPILGMFLGIAMSMFALWVFGYAITSTNNTTAIRYELLYVLSFASGLMSKQAYSRISKFADDKISGMSDTEKNHRA